jgi:hypothetical protein
MIQYVQHKLPSRGLLYDGRLPDGMVGIRKMTVREEGILANQGLTGPARIAQVVKACTQLPAGFEAEDLLVSDRHAILLALRIHTLGSSYSFGWQCGECRTSNRGKIDLIQDLDERIAPDDLVEPLLVELRDVAKETVIVGLRFLRGRDEEKVAKKSARVKMQGPPDPSDPGYIHTLALHITHVGDGKMGIEEAQEFVRGLTMADSTRIRRALEKAETGIDTRQFLTCSKCGHESYEALPMDLEFFRPTLD